MPTGYRAYSEACYTYLLRTCQKALRLQRSAFFKHGRICADCTSLLKALHCHPSVTLAGGSTSLCSPERRSAERKTTSLSMTWKQNNLNASNSSAHHPNTGLWSSAGIGASFYSVRATWFNPGTMSSPFWRDYDGLCTFFSIWLVSGREERTKKTNLGQSNNCKGCPLPYIRKLDETWNGQPVTTYSV